MTVDDLARFEKLRADLFDAITVIQSRGGSGKGYDGTFRIHYEWRPENSDNTWEPWGLFLDCYLIGPDRHYEWWGATFADVLQKAETDIRAWMHEAQEDE